MRKILVGLWDASGDIQINCIYHDMTREKAINLFYNQYIKHNFNTFQYCNDKLSGIYNSKVIKDRLLFDVSDDMIIYAQYA